MKKGEGILIQVLLIPLFLSAWAAPAIAYQWGRPWKSDMPWERISIRFGFFLTNFNSDVALSGSAGGLVVNLEDLLDLDETTTQFRVEGVYRPWKRHAFSIGYYDVSRDAETYLTVDIPDVITAGAHVEDHLDIKIYKFGYSYSFWLDDRVDLGVGIGFHVMDIGAGIKVTGQTSEGDEVVNKELVGEDTTLPLPVLNIRGAVALTKRVFIRQSFNVFYIDLSDFDGLLLDSNLALEGHICPYFGMGMGFNFLHVKIKGDSHSGFLGEGWDGELKFDYTGVFIYTKFLF